MDYAERPEPISEVRFVKQASQLEVTSDIGHKIITLWTGTELLAYRTQTMSSVISRHERFNHSYSEQPCYQLTNSLTKQKLLHRQSIFSQFQTRLNLVICLCKITHVGKLCETLRVLLVSLIFHCPDNRVYKNTEVPHCAGSLLCIAYLFRFRSKYVSTLLIFKIFNNRRKEQAVLFVLDYLIMLSV